MPNFKTRKELIQAFNNGEIITVFSPGPFPVNLNESIQFIEEPHYPKPHKWYAKVEIDNTGRVIKIFK